MNPSFSTPLVSDSFLGASSSGKRVKRCVHKPPSKKPRTKTLAGRPPIPFQPFTEKDPFFSQEQKDERLTRFINRELDSCKHLDLNWFVENNFVFPQYLIDQNLEKFCTLSGNVYPKLIAEFYANLVKRNGERITEVKGTRISVDFQTLLEVAGLKNEGIVVETILKRNWEGYNHVQTYLDCLRPNKHLDGKQLKAGSMTVNHRLLHYVLVYLLIPRKHNRAQANEEDLRFIYAIKKRIQVNWANIIIAHMLRRRNDPSGALPYPILVSKVIELAGVDVSNEAKLVLRTHADIIGKTTIHKMQIRRFGGEWKWVEDALPGQNPDPEEEEEKGAESDHQGSPSNNSSLKNITDRMQVFMVEQFSLLQSEMDKKNQSILELKERLNYGITLLESLLGNEKKDPFVSISSTDS